MLNYIRAECYKVAHRKYPYLFTLLLLLGEGLLLFSVWFVNQSTHKNDFSSTAGMLGVLLIVGLYAAIVVCDMVFSDQYKHNTLKNEVSFGISRTKIYFGKLFSAAVTALVLMAVVIGVYLLGCRAVAPLGDPAAAEQTMTLLGQRLLSALPLWLGALGVTMALFCNIRSNVAAALLSVVVACLLAAILKFLTLLTGSGQIAWLVQFCLSAPFENVVSCGRCWAIGMGWLVGSTVLGLLFFRWKEIN